MTIVDVAMLLALEAHGEARNKHDSEMYTKHLARVWINVRDAGGDETLQAIAWLHDTIEDTDLTYQAIRDALYNYNDVGVVIAGVRAMTKIKGESNEDYYYRVKENKEARFVKLHGDLVDNFRRNHNITDPETAERMMRKYSLGMDILS